MAWQDAFKNSENRLSFTHGMYRIGDQFYLKPPGATEIVIWTVHEGFDGGYRFTSSHYATNAVNGTSYGGSSEACATIEEALDRYLVHWLAQIALPGATEVHPSVKWIENTRE